MGRIIPIMQFDLNNLGKMLAQTGQAEEGLPMVEQALPILEAALGTEHPTTQKVAKNLETLRIKGT